MVRDSTRNCNVYFDCNAPVLLFGGDSRCDGVVISGGYKVRFWHVSIRCTSSVTATCRQRFSVTYLLLPAACYCCVWWVGLMTACFWPWLLDGLAGACCCRW